MTKRTRHAASPFTPSLLPALLVLCGTAFAQAQPQAQTPSQPQAGEDTLSLSFDAARARMIDRSDKLAAARAAVDAKELQSQGLKRLGGPSVSISALASLVFLVVLFAILHVFGDFGRILTVLLLTLQLSAGGGVLPVELSAGFFRDVHGWLPFSWVVQAFRAVMFGAFDNGWAHACGAVLLSGAVAVGLMAIFGKWNEVLPADYKPTIQV